jgi:hypothetical protein
MFTSYFSMDKPVEKMLFKFRFDDLAGLWNKNVTKCGLLNNLRKEDISTF